jgi:hypothetical protein
VFKCANSQACTNIQTHTNVVPGTHSLFVDVRVRDFQDTEETYDSVLQWQNSLLERILLLERLFLFYLLTRFQFQDSVSERFVCVVKLFVFCRKPCVYVVKLFFVVVKEISKPICWLIHFVLGQMLMTPKARDLVENQIAILFFSVCLYQRPTKKTDREDLYLKTRLRI